MTRGVIGYVTSWLRMEVTLGSLLRGDPHEHRAERCTLIKHELEQLKEASDLISIKDKTDRLEEIVNHMMEAREDELRWERLSAWPCRIYRREKGSCLHEYNTWYPLL